MIHGIKSRMFVPPLGVTVDRGHPDAVGLIGAWLFNTTGSSFDLARRDVPATLVNSPTYGFVTGAGLSGPAMSFANGSTQYIQLGSVINPAAMAVQVIFKMGTGLTVGTIWSLFCRGTGAG